MIGAIVDDLCVAAGSAHAFGPGEGTGPLPDDDAILRQAETGRDSVKPEKGIFAARRTMLRWWQRRVRRMP